MGTHLSLGLMRLLLLKPKVAGELPRTNVLNQVRTLTHLKGNGSSSSKAIGFPTPPVDAINWPLDLRLLSGSFITNPQLSWIPEVPNIGF